MRCPICQSELVATCDPELRPFCSSRCKKQDLANWLDGKYRLPRELTPEELGDLPTDQRDELIAAALGEPVARKLH